MNSVIDQHNSPDIESFGSFVKIYPKEIFYSQKSFSLTMYRGEGLPGVSVCNWANELPYIIHIDIVNCNDGAYCSFDNRRLYAARNYAASGFEIVARRHDCMEILPETRKGTLSTKLVL
jgi:hypothetical protein